MFCVPFVNAAEKILAHMYLDIDHGRLFDELEWIEDSETFAMAVERWLHSQEQPS